MKSFYLLAACCLMFGVSKAQTPQTMSLIRQITHPQPMTGLVLWPDEAEDRDATYGKSIQLEFSYCLPCKVVTGCETNGTILYDWSSFDQLLEEVASRGHQLVARFRYEYPSGTDVDGKKGTTAVPEYIKQRSDYNETYASNPGGDGPTYYADWSNVELQRFTLQFYADFVSRYAHDPRLAFLEVGFGHWAEYHIYGTKLRLGVNFPSKDFQKQFFLHMSAVADGLPWLVSIDAADDEYSPVVDDNEMMALSFGLFDDSFMHKDHEIGSSDGYNEECWNAIGRGTRWQQGVCGGEISYYKASDQKNFLNPAGMYGHTWEEQAAKYHITFMIANDAPGSTYGTPQRFFDGSMATGYRFVVKECMTDFSANPDPSSPDVGSGTTCLLVTNEGIAPIYRDAYFAIGDVRSTETLLGLLPGEERWIEIAAPLADPDALHIVSDCILPTQEIEFEASINVIVTGIHTPVVDDNNPPYYNLSGQPVSHPTKGIFIRQGRKVVF